MLYLLTEASIAGKPNYRVEITFPVGPAGLTGKIFSFRPDSDLNLSIDVAPILRTQLAMDPDPTLRIGIMYIVYQAVWDSSGDAPVAGLACYYYVGDNNILNKRSQLDIRTSGGEFLIANSRLYAWPARTAYLEFLNGITEGWRVNIGTGVYYGSGVRELVSIPFQTSASVTATIKKLIWTNGNSASDNNWQSVAYGNGLFVAVAITGTGNRVMTSPDGLTWTSRTSAGDYDWRSVTFGAGVSGTGLFVAVSSTAGTGNQVMTSPDGITWTMRTSAADNFWTAVTFGNGIFVAVSNSGVGNRVMTSADGVTWTARTSAADIGWSAVSYGGGIFVAVAASGAGDRVQNSFDNGVTWTLRTPTATKPWSSIAYGVTTAGVGLFIAVNGNDAVIMTSPTGVTWTAGSVGTKALASITYGGGIWVAVCVSASGAFAVQSEDGVTWVEVATPATASWQSVTFGNNLFVSINSSTTGHRAMYLAGGSTIASVSVIIQDECLNPIYLKWINDYGGLAVWLFDYNQIFNIVPDTPGRYKKMVVFIQSKSDAIWQAIEELNRTGAEYGDNKKLGAYVVDFTDEDDVINIFVEPAPASTLTKYRGNNAQLVLRYPIINNSDIS